MKRFQFVQIIAILLIAPVINAGETAYTGTLTGIECTACKKAIAQALSKIEANKALEKADHYQIRSWSKSNR